MINWSYIAGFLDGEGSLTITKHKRSSSKTRLVSRIDFYNSNEKVIKKIQKFLEKYEINCKIYKRQLDKKWKFVFSLKILRLEDQFRLLEYIKNKLIVKTEQYKVLFNFLKIRINKIKKKEYDFSEEEFKLQEKIHHMNGRGFDYAN